MSMVGQSESDDIFVSGVKAKKLMITGSSIFLFLFQWKNKNVDLFTMGSLIFGIQNKIFSDLLCPTILILLILLPVLNKFGLTSGKVKQKSTFGIALMYQII